MKLLFDNCTVRGRPNPSSLSNVARLDFLIVPKRTAKKDTQRTKVYLVKMLYFVRLNFQLYFVTLLAAITVILI